MEAVTTGSHVFGTEETLIGSSEDLSLVSDRIHNLANSIYKEFEAMIGRYGENVVENLMPLIVGMLEGMDQLYTDKHNLEIDLELLKEDNTQLVSQYEREKQQRKQADEKILKVEDNYDEEKKELEEKNESLESLLRIMELKARNAQEQVNRFEEKENEFKKEYSQLHERYTELFRSHMDYIERSRMMGHSGPLKADHGDPVDPTSGVRVSRPRVCQLSGSQRANVQSGRHNGEITETSDYSTEHYQSHRSDEGISLQKDLENSIRDWDASDEDGADSTRSIGDPVNGPSHRPIDEFEVSMSPIEHPMNMDYGEDGGDFEDLIGKVDDMASLEDYGEIGMSREIENLIQENTELIETKHALNIVKDDLIVKLDDLTGENIMLREENNSLNIMKTKMKEKNSELEHDLKDAKEQIERANSRLAELQDDDEESETPGSGKRTRFTRTEMSRVLMERNLYKERLMELQEAVRFTEAMRVKRQEEKQAPDTPGDRLNSLLASLQLPPAPPDMHAEAERVVVVDEVPHALPPPPSAFPDEMNGPKRKEGSKRSKSMWGFFSGLVESAADALMSDVMPPPANDTPASGSLLYPSRPASSVNSGPHLVAPSATSISLRRSPGSAQRLQLLQGLASVNNVQPSAPNNPLLCVSQKNDSEVSAVVQQVRLVPEEIRLLPPSSSPVTVESDVISAKVSMS